MKPRAFAALAVATALSLLFAIVSYASNNRWAQNKVSGAALIPGLAVQAGKVARIEVKQGDRTVTLARQAEGGWSLADRAGYPAKAETARALLLKLAEAELVEPKTRAKDKYSVLEVEDPAGKDAKSRLVRLLDDNGAVLGEAIVGKKRFDAFGANRSGSYVRRVGDAQSWLANADIDASLAVRDWVVPGVFEVSTAKISAATIEIPGEQPLRIARDGAGGTTPKHNFVGEPQGKKLKDNATVDGIVRGIAAIDMEDVRKTPATAAAADKPSLVKIEADGGLSVTLRFVKEGDNTWVAIAASGADGDAKKSAEEITRRTQGWEFKVPASRTQAILKRRADLYEGS